jgi:MFS family permease
MNDILLSYRELYIYVMIAGAIVGALFGLVPLIIGRRKNRKRLGVYGFIASIVGGAIAPLLGMLVAGLFFWLVVREKPSTDDNRSDKNDQPESAAE